MANPQKENGHTGISNEILERLYSIPISGSEFRILLCIIRQSWGWHKKNDRISLSQLTTKTKLSRKQVCNSINKLVTKRLLFKGGEYIKEYQFNKDYEQWLVTERLLGGYDEKQLPKGNYPSYRTVTKLVTDSTPKLVTDSTPTKEKKETTKETITKERVNYNQLDNIKDVLTRKYPKIYKGEK